MARLCATSQEWAVARRDELQANWERARRADTIVPIDPLA